MTITLRQEHEKLIAEAMQTGAYRNADEVIERALEMLHSEDEWLRGRRDQAARKIERAFEQFERGECFSPEDSRADMKRRKAEWLREYKR
jgi:Arc/MetJ-type ribon-helix-helix transcriptional regulator